MESHLDQLDLIAHKVVRILSQKDEIHLSARRIVMNGGGSQLVIERGAIRGTTEGPFEVHATTLAIDKPGAVPLVQPVTPERPGKLVAHPVLVEHGGGFALPDQPYRIQLDDGRIIKGVTNAHGELEKVTSNEVVFGKVEFMAQSQPDHVIAVSDLMVHRDASLPAPPMPPVPSARTTKVAGRQARAPEEGSTTGDQPPMYARCDPLNFGLRSYRLLDGAKEEDLKSSSIPVSMDVEYPVTKAYTAAIKTALKSIDWAAFKTTDGTVPRELTAAIAKVVSQSLADALGTGPFGLPAGPAGKSKGAMPAIDIVSAERGRSKYNMPANVSAAFAAKW